MSSEANVSCACWRCGDRPDDGTAHVTDITVTTTVTTTTKSEDDPTTIDGPPTTGA